MDWSWYNKIFKVIGKDGQETKGSLKYDNEYDENSKSFDKVDSEAMK